MTPRVRQYIKEAAERHGVDPGAVSGRDRHPIVVRARAEVMRRLRWNDGFTTSQIGKWMDRDHSTVVHATRGYMP